jgi:hypothetical protein
MISYTFIECTQRITQPHEKEFWGEDQKSQTLKNYYNELSINKTLEEIGEMALEPKELDESEKMKKGKDQALEDLRYLEACQEQKQTIDPIANGFNISPDLIEDLQAKTKMLRQVNSGELSLQEGISQDSIRQKQRRERKEPEKKIQEDNDYSVMKSTRLIQKKYFKKK